MHRGRNLCGTRHNSHCQIYSRELLSDVQRSIKLIDDGCLQPRNAQETYDMTAKVMLSAIRDNFKFSMDKFKISPTAIFAGLLLETLSSGSVTIKPDPDGIRQLLDFPSQKC